MTRTGFVLSLAGLTLMHMVLFFLADMAFYRVVFGLGAVAGCFTLISTLLAD